MQKGEGEQNRLLERLFKSLASPFLVCIEALQEVREVSCN